MVVRSSGPYTLPVKDPHGRYSCTVVEMKQLAQKGKGLAQGPSYEVLTVTGGFNPRLILSLLNLQHLADLVCTTALGVHVIRPR